MTRRLSARAARGIVDAAVLVKAPDWSESRAWRVVSDGLLLAVLEPAWRAGRRDGWRWRLADSATWSSRPQPTREKAAVTALAAWQRWATRKEN